MSGPFQLFRKETAAERLARFDLRPDTIAAAQAMVTDRRTDPQIVALEKSLTASETVLRIVESRHERVPGLLVLTSERIFFRARRGDDPIRFTLPLSAVETVEGSTRKVMGTVRISSPDALIVVDDILGRQGEWFADQASSIIRGDARPKQDPIAALSELRKLRETGSITAAEFEARKAELWKDI